MEVYDAILPAAGRLDPGLAAVTGTEVKALIPFGGKTILQATLEALRDSGRVGRTVVIGPKELAEHEGAKLATTTLEPVGSAPDNILHGLKHLLATDQPPKKVLIVGVDLPFITPETFTTFLDKCAPDVDFCVPLITKGSFEAKYPGTPSTFVQLKDDTYTAGCAYLMDVAALQKAIPQMEYLFQNRKSTFGMARIMGAGFLFKLLTKTLTIPDVKRKIHALLGTTGEPVLDAPAELAYDIDDLADYDYAVKYLGQRG